MLPGFNAEVSLYKLGENYRGASAPAQMGQAGSVTPAWGIDCYPMCVIFAERRCRLMCPPHSIDCLPMCIIMAEGRCHRLCEVPQ